MWRVSVNDDCIGSGCCAGVAANHFVLADGRSRPIHDEVAPDEAVLDAVASCPMEAIVVVDVDTGEVVSVGQ